MDPTYKNIQKMFFDKFKGDKTNVCTMEEKNKNERMTENEKFSTCNRMFYVTSTRDMIVQVQWQYNGNDGDDGDSDDDDDDNDDDDDDDDDDNDDRRRKSKQSVVVVGLALVVRNCVLTITLSTEYRVYEGRGNDEGIVIERTAQNVGAAKKKIHKASRKQQTMHRNKGTKEPN